MKRYFFLFALLLLAGTNIGRPVQPEIVTAQPADSMEAEVIRLVNRHRESLHLPPLKTDPLLGAIARTFSERMAGGKAPFRHTGFEQRRDAYIAGRGTVGAFGENIAQGQHSAEQVMQAWLHSTGHRKNIEGTFGYIGVGIGKDRNGRLYFTQLFSLLR